MKKGISVLLAVLLSIVILPGKKGVSMQNPLDFLILNRSIIEDSSSISRIEKDTFLFPLKQLSVDSTKGNLSFSFPNCSVSTVPEAPDFPVYKKTYSMELCESVSYIDTVSVEGICLGYSNSRIATVPEPKRYGIEDEVGVGVYRTSVNVSEFSSTYPAVNVQSKVSSIDNKKTLSLVIHPLHIHEGALYLLTHIEIEIGFGTGFQPLSIPNNKKNSSIILAPDEFKEAANALAEIQKGNGYDVDVVLLSEIEKLEPAAFPKIVASGYSKEKADSGEYAGFLKDYDYILSAKIRTLLETRLKNDRVDYLTIIGDAFWVPPSFYYFGNDYRIKKWAERYVPTDFHYMAPFASEWDVNFSISVGRIPVHNAVHASLYIDKIRDYYASLESHEPWTNTVSLFSGDPFRGDYYSELIQIDSINKDVLNGLNIYKYFQTDGLFLEEQCKKVMFSGNNRLLWLSGHGSGTEFYTADGCIGVQDLLEAPTNKQLPIIISESCLNGMWDSQLINGQEKVPPVSFSESLFQSKAAGIAYIGGARTNYSYGEVRYNKSVPAIEKVTYMDAAIQYTNENMNCSNSTLGDAVKKSLETYYRNDILSQEYLKQIYTPDVNTLFGYCLLGDPTLPTISSESKPSYSTPAIHSIEEYDPTGRNIPVFSVDNGQTIQISSDSPTLRYVYSSYDNKENGLYFSDIMEPSGENRYQKHFVHFVKAKGCLRFETADKKETRSVFEAKHDIDVGVEIETPSLSIVHQNEFVTCAFRVRNDGIYDTGPIEVVTSVKGNAIGFFPIENIPPLTSVLHNYTFHPTECTNETVRVSANVLNGDDTFPDNDMCNKQYRVPEGKIFRVGVLTTSGNSSLYFRDSVTNNTLDLDKLNTLFWDDNINIEIQTVSNYVNKNGNVSYDILGFDALVLYGTIWYDFPLSLFRKELDKFITNGGKVLGICPFSPERMKKSIWNAQMQSFFGIKSDVEMKLVETEKGEMSELSFLESIPGFQQNSYMVHNYCTLLPLQEANNKEEITSWSEAQLLPGANVVATSNKEIAYIQYNSQIYFYNGYFDSNSYKKQEDTFRLFRDMLLSMAGDLSAEDSVQLDNASTGTFERWNSKPIENQTATKETSNEQVVNAVEMKNAKEVLSYQKEHQYFIVDFKKTEEELYIATPFEIQVFNEEEVLVETIPYPSELYQGYTSIVPLLAGENSAFFDVTTNYIVLSVDDRIIIQDRKNYDTMRVIYQKDYTNPLTENILFSKIADILVLGDSIYVTTRSSFLRFDIHSGKLLLQHEICAEWDPTPPFMSMFNDEYIMINSNGFIIYHIPSDQISLSLFCYPFDVYSSFQKDSNTVTILFLGFALETVKGIDFAFKDLLESRYFPFEFSGDLDEFICFNTIDTASHVLHECGDLYVLSKKKKEIEALTYISYSELTVYDKKSGEPIKTFFQNDLDTIQENNKLLPLSTDVKVLSNGERYCVRLDSCISSLEYDIMEYFRESDPDFAVLDCKSGQKKVVNRLYFGDCEFYLPEILHKGVWSGYCFNENEWGCLQFDLSGEWSELENGSFISLEYDGTYLPYTKALALTDTYICIYSEASSSIVWYDRKTGKRIQQQLLLGNDSGSNLGYSTICINEMTSDGDWVYLHDTYNNCIYSCNSKTGFGPTIRLDDCYPYLDYRNLVAYQGKVYLLQTSTSQIAVYEDGTFQGWVLPEDVGAQSIESFDIGFEEIVVNDVQAGWVYSLPFDTLGKKKKVN